MRAAKAGLWADPKPIPPWDWRHKGKQETADDPFAASEPQRQAESKTEKQTQRQDTEKKYWLTTSTTNATTKTADTTRIARVARVDLMRA